MHVLHLVGAGGGKRTYAENLKKENLKKVTHFSVLPGWRGARPWGLRRERVGLGASGIGGIPLVPHPPCLWGSATMVLPEAQKVLPFRSSFPRHLSGPHGTGKAILGSGTWARAQRAPPHGARSCPQEAEPGQKRRQPALQMRFASLEGPGRSGSPAAPSDA